MNCDFFEEEYDDDIFDDLDDGDIEVLFLPVQGIKIIFLTFYLIIKMVLYHGGSSWIFSKRKLIIQSPRAKRCSCTVKQGLEEPVHSWRFI